MAFANDVEIGVARVLAPEWNIVNGTVAPKTTDVVLYNGAVKLDATYLYADMADSTGLAQNFHGWAVAKVIRCYLDAASRVINHYGGEIRSFDGDRVMAIFVGQHKNTSAVRTALAISWAVSQVIQPALEAKWSDFKWTMKHGVGIDTGEALIVRGGVRGDNDLVSVGGPPNVAAKLSEERGWPSIFITNAVYQDMAPNVTLGAAGENMWSDLGPRTYGGKLVRCLGSAHYWGP